MGFKYKSCLNVAEEEAVGGLPHAQWPAELLLLDFQSRFGGKKTKTTKKKKP